MTKQQKQKAPGDTLITVGIIVAVLGVMMFVLAIASGGPGNPALTFGMLVVGLLLVVIGYLQRRSAP